ncbi:hypothetical protein LC040_10715 [Bacillus tianshenii]|nr:hypothetical protein LC040_10715 [Bacillus tianshenii]
MKRVFRFFLISLGLLMLVGCTSPDDAQSAPRSKKITVMKEAVTGTFFSNQTVMPYEAVMENFQSFVEWFDTDTVLFLTQQDETSRIYKYDLFTGKKALFYSSKAPITQVDSNYSHSYFAIQTVHRNQEKSLIVLNDKGKEAFSWRGFAEGLQTIWNPYQQEKVLVSMILKDWQFSVYETDVQTGHMAELNVANPFVQWVNRQTLAYLNWNQQEPDFSAPLYLVDIPTQQETKALENVYAAFSFSGVMLAISADGPKQQFVDFTFYQSESFQPVASLKAPVLQTFSEQMWIPQHVYDRTERTFYYMKATYPGDISSYDGKFELTSFSLEDEQEKKVREFERNVPLKISPGGTWCLIGNRYEEIINLKTGKVFSLLL